MWIHQFSESTVLRYRHIRALTGIVLLIIGGSHVAAAEEISGQLRWDDGAFEKPFGSGLILRVEILKDSTGAQTGVLVSILNKKNPAKHQQVICREYESAKFTNCFGDCDDVLPSKDRMEFLIRELDYAKRGIELRYFLDTLPEKKMAALEDACEHCNHFQTEETYAECKRTRESVRTGRGVFTIKDYKLTENNKKLEFIRFVFTP